MTGPAAPLVETLLSHAERTPDSPAFIAGGETVSYGRLARMICAAAERIRRAIAGQGERVLLCGTNSPALAAAYFAVHAAGGVAVLLDADAVEETARRTVDDSEACLALVSHEQALPCKTENLAAFCLADTGCRLASPRAVLADAADLLYTTGTTGRRKGVLLTHRNVAQAAVNIAEFMGTVASDREVVPLPLSHSFGLGRLRVMALVGHTLLLTPGMRNPAAVLKLVLDARATGLALVPAGVDLILRMTRDRMADAAGHLRYVEIGSSAMSLESKRKLMELLPNTRICHHYGLTEASRAAFLEYHSDREHLASAGRPSPNVEMAVCDEHGRELPDGQEGELVIRGGMVMREYWKQQELTREALRDGWLRSGDRGRRNAGGYYHLTGRQSNVVNVGGWKVSPEEVEAVISRHPAVAEAACTGMADPEGITGECLKACLVLRSEIGDEELVHWLRQRLEEHKIPRAWQRVPQLPKTPSGKIQRHLL